MIREHFDHGKLFRCFISKHVKVADHADLAEAVNKITNQRNAVKSELADLDKLPSSKQCSASYMSSWEKKTNEKKKLAKCLSDIITSMIKAMDELHNCGHVSLNIRGWFVCSFVFLLIVAVFPVSNFFVRTNCHCWGTATCVHDSSGMMVIIRGCDMTHNVGSVVTGHPDSKAFKVHAEFIVT